MFTPLERLRHHVSGAIARGEAEAIVERPTHDALKAHLDSLQSGREDRCIAAHLDLLAEWSRRVESAGFDPATFA